MKVKYVHKSPYRDANIKLVCGETYDLPEHVINSMRDRFETITKKESKPEVKSNGSQE